MVPATITAALISIAIFGIAAGALWIFVLGDDPWPDSAGIGMGLVSASVFVTVLAILLKAAYEAGKKQEAASNLKLIHVGFSAAATLVLTVLIIVQQYSVGNLGKPSFSVMCADYCRAEGFNISRMPPKEQGASLCSCLDNSGSEVIKVSLDTINKN